MRSDEEGRPMPAEYEARSKYLTLALEARKVVDLLLPLIERGRTDATLHASLTGLISSLESSGNAETLLARLRAPGPRPVYEELLTGEELETMGERTQLIQQLRNVIEETNDLPTQQVSAKEAVLILCAVEGRALHHFARLSRSEALSITA
jgi:hypothetical protein